MQNNDSNYGYKTITVQQARQLMCNISCYTVFVDVRRDDEYQSGHIKGAINIPLGQLQQKAPLMLPDLNQEIILYCRTGSRSHEGANVLLSQGYTNVYDMGGIDRWCFGIEK